MRLDRNETEELIAKLAQLYPKCFFQLPQQRKPLKKNIVDDLMQDGCSIASEALPHIMTWYESHFAYQYALQAGAKRLGLNGEEVGVVTATEQRNAEKYIAERKQEMSERNLGSPVAVALGLRRTERITDDALRKIDAPRSMKEPKMIAKGDKSDPLTELQGPIDDLRRALRDNPEPFRTAFAVAGLQVVVDIANKMIAELKKNEGRA